MKIGVDKISYFVGIVVAAGGLVSAIIGDKEQKELKDRVEALEKASKNK